MRVHQKEQSDKYFKKRMTAFLLKYVREELWSSDYENCQFPCTGNPEIKEMSETELETFQLGKLPGI